MGFEELASEIQKQSDSEAKKLLASSERQAAKTEDEAKERADEQLKEAKKEATAYIRQESSERLTSAKLDAKKIVDEARDDAVETALHQAWKAYKAEAMKKSAYPSLLARLVKEGAAELGASDAVIYCREEDRQHLLGYKLSRLPPEYSGGVIVESSNGKIRVNKTLEESFAQQKPELRKKIFDRLF